MDYFKVVCVLYSFVRFFAFGWKVVTFVLRNEGKFSWKKTRQVKGGVKNPAGTEIDHPVNFEK